MKPFSVFLFACVSLYSLPSGMKVIAGTAETGASDANSLTIRSENQTILQWDSFSIGQNEMAQFMQLGKDAAVLNRVMGGSMSEILGMMQSNGQVYLINPNGVLIGPDARIESAGFLASTLDVLDADFLAGKELLFAGDSNGAILNLGTISCPRGDVALFARFVKNEGNIVAKEGSVFLASAPEVLLKPEGKERIYIRPDLGSEKSEDGPFPLENRGQIEALSVELKSGASPYIQAIRNAGSISAIATVEENGIVYLVAEQGYTEMSGSITANSGEVRILGDQAALFNGAKIDVSGDAGGGTVLIGGSFQGEDDSIKVSRATIVQEGVEIHADALKEGDGGQIVLWSSDRTGFYGSASAKGGEFGGDGGVVEVSGPQLFYAGLCSTAAPRGKTGTLLLDPNDITISTAATTNIATAWTPRPAYYSGFPPGANPSNLNTGDLVAALNLNNVLVQTDDLEVGGTGTINIQNDIVGWTAATQLTLRATSLILIDPTVTINNTSTGTGLGDPFTAIYFIANQANVLGAGNGIFLNDATIVTDAGNVYLNGVGGSAGAGNHGVNIFAMTGARGITTNSGSITLIGKASPDQGVATSDNSGVFIHGSGGANTASVFSNEGNITILGTSFSDRVVPSMTMNNQGVLIDSSAIVNAPIGVILIEGIGGNGTTSRSSGVEVSNLSTVTTSVGSIHIIGHGHGTGSDNYGVLINANTTVSSTGASSPDNLIFIEGTAGGGAGGNNNGIQVSNIASVTSLQGSIKMVGFGGGDGANNNGIFIYNSGVVSLTGVGANGSTISLVGTATTSALATDFNSGVSIIATPAGFGINSLDKDISVLGYAAINPTGSNNHGINISNNAGPDGPGRITGQGGARVSLTGIGPNGGGTTPNSGIAIQNNVASLTLSQVTTETGLITLSGTTRGASSAGVLMNIQSQIFTDGGSIMITGSSFGAGASNPGIQITDAIVQSPGVGPGSIILTGMGSPGGTNFNHGVLFSFVTAAPGFIVGTVDHDIIVNGIAGGTGSGNSGIAIEANGGATLQFGNMIGVGDAGSIILNGIGAAGAAMLPANHGIYVAGNGMASPVFISTGIGDLQLTGNGGTGAGLFGNCDGIHAENFTRFASDTGNISFYGGATSANDFNNGISLQNTTISSTGMGPGTLILTGIGSANGTNSNNGILIEDVYFADSVSSVEHDIYLVGVGGGTGTDNLGISLVAPGLVNTSIRSTGATADAADIHLEGTGGVGTNHNAGITLDGAVAIVNADFGNISMLGVGNGSGINNYGVEFINGASSNTSGGVGSTNTIQIEGRGSRAGAANNIGVNFNTGGGTGGIGSSTQNVFIRAESGGSTSTAFLLDTAHVFGNGTSNSVNIQTIGLDAAGGDFVMQHPGSVISTSISGVEEVVLAVQGNFFMLDGAGINTSRITGKTGGNFTINAGGALSTGIAGLLAGSIMPLIVGNIYLDIGGNLTLTGGAVMNQGALIQNASGQITILVDGDLQLTAGSAANACAQIGGFGGNADIFFPIIAGNVIITGGAAWADVGCGIPVTFLPGPNPTGSITFELIGGNVTLRGGAGGGFAQIGHINAPMGGPFDISGNIRVNALGNVIFNDVATANYSQIGHGTPGGVGTFTGLSAVEVFAGGAINMAGIAGQAIITNPSTTGSAVYPASGSITLVADNANPLNPFLGAASFFLNATSSITNVPATGGQVRLYTSVQNLAAIVPGQIINGAVYMASAMPGVDTAYEKFNLYYGAGQFDGPEFDIYYKFPFVLIPFCPTCPVCSTCPTCPSGGGGGGTDGEGLFFPELYIMAVAEAQLTDLLPNVPIAHYQGRFCSDTGIGLPSCFGGLDFFESFVFESTVDRLLPFEED